MKKIVLFVLVAGVLHSTGCVTPKGTTSTDGNEVSKINQPRAVPKKYTTITTVTETKPDGSVVTTRTTSVVVPLEDGTEKEALVGPDVIAMHKEGGPTGELKESLTAADPMTTATPKTQNPGTTSANNVNPETSLTNTSAAPDYMSAREREMIREINMVRTNPRGYIQHIENYKKDIQKVKYSDIDFLERELIASDELINELRTMQPVPALKDHRGLYNVAMSHGMTIQKRGYSSHLGNDGSYPWDRITNAVPELVDGNENLVGGPESVRDAVILLLVDSGIQGRGHRKTLLQRDWEFVACYEVGEVGGIKNYWVQNFAKSGKVPVSSTTSEIEDPSEDFPNLTSSVNQGPEPGMTINPNPPITNPAPATTTTSSWGGVRPGETTTTTKPSTTSTWNSSNPIGSTTTTSPTKTTTPPPVTTTTSPPNTTTTRPAETTTTARPPVTTTSPPATTTTSPATTSTTSTTPPPRSNPTIEAAISPTTPSADIPVEERKFDTGRSVPYLTTREKDMIFEINRARANPQRYVRYIDEYRAKVKRNNNPNSPETKEELAAIDELRQMLSTMAPLPVLQPSRAVYDAARKHGDEMKANGKVSHIGSNGSYPWDRILLEDSSLRDGNENLVGGPEDVREAVILLLVDAGISGRGHRKTLLNKDWKYVAVYEVGTVGRMKNTWVQNFAR